MLFPQETEAVNVVDLKIQAEKHKHQLLLLNGEIEAVGIQIIKLKRFEIIEYNDPCWSVEKLKCRQCCEEEKLTSWTSFYSAGESFESWRNCGASLNKEPSLIKRRPGGLWTSTGLWSRTTRLESFLYLLIWEPKCWCQIEDLMDRTRKEVWTFTQPFWLCLLKRGGILVSSGFHFKAV